MKHLFLLSAAFALALFISSCSKEPSACFTVGSSPDSLYLHQPILFDASCSKDATQFKWTFSDQPDSVYYAKMFYRTFDDIDSAGITVRLTAILGGRESVKEETITVQ